MADRQNFLEKVGDRSTAEYASYARDMQVDGWTAFARDDNAAAFAREYVDATGRECVMRSGFGGRIEVRHT